MRIADTSPAQKQLLTAAVAQLVCNTNAVTVSAVLRSDLRVALETASSGTLFARKLINAGAETLIATTPDIVCSLQVAARDDKLSTGRLTGAILRASTGNERASRAEELFQLLLELPLGSRASIATQYGLPIAAHLSHDNYSDFLNLVASVDPALVWRVMWVAHCRWQETRTRHELVQAFGSLDSSVRDSLFPTCFEGSAPADVSLVLDLMEQLDPAESLREDPALFLRDYGQRLGPDDRHELAILLKQRSAPVRPAVMIGVIAALEGRISDDLRSRCRALTETQQLEAACVSGGPVGRELMPNEPMLVLMEEGDGERAFELLCLGIESGVLDVGAWQRLHDPDAGNDLAHTMLMLRLLGTSAEPRAQLLAAALKSTIEQCQAIPPLAPRLIADLSTGLRDAEAAPLLDALDGLPREVVCRALVPIVSFASRARDELMGAFLEPLIRLASPDELCAMMTELGGDHNLRAWVSTPSGAEALRTIVNVVARR